MASSIAAITMPRSIDFSRATASAICSSSSLLALTAAMALLSFGGVGFASPPFFCGEPVFFGVLGGFLLVRLQFWLRFVAFRGLAGLGMRRRWRLKSEVAAQLALGGLAAPHRFRDQIVGQNQSCIRDVFHHQHDDGIFAFAYVIPMYAHRLALHAFQRAA